MPGGVQGSRGFAHKDARYVEINSDCERKIVQAIPLEQKVIDLLFEAAQTWERFVSPGSVSKQIADTEADLQRAQELYIHGEISKEILDILQKCSRRSPRRRGRRLQQCVLLTYARGLLSYVYADIGWI